LIEKNKTRIDAMYGKYEKKHKQVLGDPASLNISGLTIYDLKKMLDDAGLEVPLEKISMVFGMSKQTVVNDNDVEGQRRLQVLAPVEFLEFIGRISAVIFFDTEM
jgi:hypothetical protein